MDRGPVALFGAIVAIGLGPAMWLGAQFGSIEVDPSRPPAVVGEHGVVPDRLVGGTGAGADAADDSVINATPQSEVEPTTPSASPSRSAKKPARVSPTPTRSSASPEPSRTSASATPPTESTSGPTTPATGSTGSTGSPVPPSPPVQGDTSEGDTSEGGATEGGVESISS